MPFPGAIFPLGYVHMTNGNRNIGRRHLVAGASACSLVGALAGSRLHAQTPPVSPTQAFTPRRQSIRLQPFDLRADQITDIKVCLRPFRPMGPRFDVEHVGSKLVFHNYGHGGSGWSLS
ncbi:hypothetical protein GCM10023158_34480 [Gluconacetobacter tumulicola]